MLKTLKTKYFRKLTDHSFDFTDGLQVVRGANEAGKSTMLEAVAYALFGVKACRDPLDQVVTWGQPEKALKVELVFEYDGVPYTVTRSKSGAEINYPSIVTAEEFGGIGGPARPQQTVSAGGRVTGQNECSAFVERLLGVNSTSVSRLMLASQGSIRGALEAGSKATMELIEQLADFDVIDRVLELCSDNLQTGHTGPIQEKTQLLEEKAEALHGAMEEPDKAAFDQGSAELVGAIETAQKELNEVWKPAHDAAQAEVNSAQAAKQTREGLVSSLKRAKDNLLVCHQQIKDAQAKGAAPSLAGTIAELEATIRDAAAAAGRVSAFAEINKLLKAYPEEFWDEDSASLAVAIQEAQATATVGQEELAKTRGDLRALRGQVQSGEGTCKACGQVLPNAEAVAKHNAEVQAKVVVAEAAIKLLEAAAATAAADVKALTNVQTSARAYEQAADKHAELVEVDRSNVPPRLKWKGEAPVPAQDPAKLKAELAALQAQEAGRVAAAGRAQTLAETVPQQEANTADLEVKINACASADNLPALRAKLTEVDSQYYLRVNGIGENKARLGELERQFAVAMANYGNYVQRQAEADSAVATAKTELKQVEFNNALVKAVRAARPVIADKLWTVVLAAVSTYFSTMRGEKSVVTREGNNFKVDGHVVGGGGLSGSALDLLGLSVRMALTRTFLPTAPFLILDEPAAAMDEERTRQMLGFLVAAGFKQTILVTHEGESETVADNLITI